MFQKKKSVHNPDKEVVSIKSNSSDHSFVKKDKSYVIVGSATNLWTKTVNWLLQQDAKKLIFVIDGTASVTRRSQRIIYSLIQKHCDVSFVMTSAERFNTVKEGETLLRELTTYSKIEAIFCVEMVRYVARYNVRTKFGKKTRLFCSGNYSVNEKQLSI